jgi:hypothetical protein
MTVPPHGPNLNIGRSSLLLKAGQLEVVGFGSSAIAGMPAALPAFLYGDAAIAIAPAAGNPAVLSVTLRKRALPP